jgi:ABC-type transport system involved in cytochrome bd biosynthesis fused ATPase/permease subunit
VINTFKNEFMLIVALAFLDGALRLGISVIILYLFNAVSDSQLTNAYIYTAAIIIIYYSNQLVKQTTFVKSYILASRIKSSLAMILYGKISSLTAYVIKSSQLGKITNLLASDLGVIEMRMATFLTSFSFPLYAIGSVTLLVTRLGWPGVLGIVVVIFTVPLSNCISKKNGALI